MKQKRKQKQMVVKKLNILGLIIFGLLGVTIFYFLFTPVKPRKILEEYHNSFKEDSLVDSFFVSLSSTRLFFEDFSMEQHVNLDTVFVDDNIKVRKYVGDNFDYFNTFLSNYDIKSVYYTASKRKFNLFLQGVTKYGGTPSSILIEVLVTDSQVTYNFYYKFDKMFTHTSILDSSSGLESTVHP